MLALCLLWTTSRSTSALRAPPLRPRARCAQTPRRAAAVTERDARVVAVAKSKADLVAAADLCGVAFPPSTAAEHLKVLENPGSLSNVFFDVRGDASVALLREDGFAVACAQLVPCAVRREASETAAGAPALWVQCLCVAPHRRRTGAARRLMEWVEAEAAAAAFASEAPRAEVWLAVREANAPALGLYEGMGFAGDAASRLGHAVLRKAVAAAPPPPGEPRGAAAAFDVVAGGTAAGLPLAAAAAEAGPAVLVGVVALLGASALIAPFCYGGLGEPAPAAMVRDLIGSAPLPEIGVGLACAVAAEAARRVSGGADEEEDPVAALERDPSLAAQKAALWRVTGAGAAGPADAVAAVALWQGLVAGSEELYYRAFLQNGLFHGVGAVSGLPIVGDAVALLATTALFAVAHAGYVDDVDDSADVDRAALARGWLVDVAPFGLLLGAEFAATGHHLVAPICTHAALNTYWSALDAEKLRSCGDRARLAELMGAGGG